MAINFNKLFLQDIINKQNHSPPLSSPSLSSSLSSESCDYSPYNTDYCKDEFEPSLSPNERTHQLINALDSLKELFELKNTRLTSLHKIDCDSDSDFPTQLSKTISDDKSVPKVKKRLDSNDEKASVDKQEQQIEISSRKGSCQVSDRNSTYGEFCKPGNSHHHHHRKNNPGPQIYAQDNAVTESTKDTFKHNERLSKKKESTRVEIRVVFLKIGEIDTLKELYHADAFIQAKWREPRLDGKSSEELSQIDLQKCWNPLIFIENILTESKDQHWILAQTDEYDQAFIVERRRLRGVFLETLELNDFPLDVQDLTITLTSERPDTEVQLIPDSNELCGINVQTFVDQQEWRLHEHIEVTKQSVIQEYTSSSQSHPCISVTCRAARRPGYFYWNVFLIMFFITSLSFATFAVPPERPENRLQLSFTLFLTSVAFKFVINQSLPKISYLTYMDKYVLMSLAILCLISVWHATVTLMPCVEIHRLKSTLNIDKPPFSIHRHKILALFGYKDILYPKINHTKLEVSETDKSLLEQMHGKSAVSADFLKWEKDRRIVKEENIIDDERIKMLEYKVFISFTIVYVIAHMVFGFWLYFDASRRRREMIERDKQYKMWLAKATEKLSNEKPIIVPNGKRKFSAMAVRYLNQQEKKI